MDGISSDKNIKIHLFWILSCACGLFSLSSTELLHVIAVYSKGCGKFMDSNVCFSSDLKYTSWSSGL